MIVFYNCHLECSAQNIVSALKGTLPDLGEFPLPELVGELLADCDGVVCSVLGEGQLSHWANGTFTSGFLLEYYIRKQASFLMQLCQYTKLVHSEMSIWIHRCYIDIIRDLECPQTIWQLLGVRLRRIILHFKDKSTMPFYCWFTKI